MQAEVGVPLPVLYGFLFVLARVGGALVFVPVPGLKQGPEPARIVLTLAFAVALAPFWPMIEVPLGIGRLAGWLVMEAALGVLIGLAVSFVTEAFVVAAQVVGLPAGYAYASMVDPQTQADSGVLLVLAQLTAGMLFFALGLDREVLRIFVRSLETYPPGAFVISRPAAEAVLQLGAGVFTTALRLAMPALALLLLIDVAIALLGRLHAQLQLLILGFPVKMMAAIGVLAWISVVFPRIYGEFGGQALGVVWRVIGQGSR